MINCKQCKETFQGRKGKRFCSSTCRLKAFRNETVSVETDKSVSKSITLTKLDAIKAYQVLNIKTDNKCPEVEHATDCMLCKRLEKPCKEKYHNCINWGICIESYHKVMCTI